MVGRDAAELMACVNVTSLLIVIWMCVPCGCVSDFQNKQVLFQITMLALPCDRHVWMNAMLRPGSLIEDSPGPGCEAIQQVTSGILLSIRKLI